MVVIRLARGGAKKRPFYHIVVTDQRNPRDGRYIERLGYFNPVARGQEIPLHLERERIQHWISVGAQPTGRVATLIKQFDQAPQTDQLTAAAKVKAKVESKVEPEAKSAEAPAKADTQPAEQPTPATEAPTAVIEAAVAETKAEEEQKPEAPAETTEEKAAE